MKKSVLLIICLLLTTVLLTGCITEPAHKTLSSTWLEEEVATYEVERVLVAANSDKNITGESVKGTQTFTTHRINGQDVTVGPKTLEKVNGTFIDIKTVMDDGSTMDAAVFFSTKFVPIASFKKIFVKGYENQTPKVDSTQEVFAEYKDKNYNYKAIDNGITSEGAIKVSDWEKSPYFDNLMIYHIARSSFKTDKGFVPMTFKVPTWSSNELKTLSLSLSNAEVGVKFMDKEISTTKININLQQKFPGSGKPIEAWYSNGAVNESKNARVLIKYVEGSMTYTLTNITFKA